MLRFTATTWLLQCLQGTSRRWGRGEGRGETMSPPHQAVQPSLAHPRASHMPGHAGGRANHGGSVSCLPLIPPTLEEREIPLDLPVDKANLPSGTPPRPRGSCVRLGPLGWCREQHGRLQGCGHPGLWLLLTGCCISPQKWLHSSTGLGHPFPAPPAIFNERL